MAEALMDDVGMGLGRYLKTRPDLFRPERSPIRTVLWVVVALIGVAIGITAVLTPEAFIRGGRESVGVRGGLGMIVAPVFFFGLGIVGVVWWSRRWRTPGGGKMRSALSHAFTATDPGHVWAALESATSPSDPAVIGLFSRIYRDAVLPGAFVVDVMHSPEDRILVGMVTRHVPKKPGDAQGGMRNQLEREPIVRVGDDYIDFSVTAAAAIKNI